MTSVLVTGTNQGIGLGLVRLLSKREDVVNVFATVRDPESPGTAELKKLASPKVHIIKLELNEASISVNDKTVRLDH